MTESSFEKVSEGKTLLLSEPILFRSNDFSNLDRYLMFPKGAEKWAARAAELALPLKSDLDITQLVENLRVEYVGIVLALIEQGVPFRAIITDRNKVDQTMILSIFMLYGIRSVEFRRGIRSSVFPRDWLVDFNGKVFINPDANLYIPNVFTQTSALGEGGNVLNTPDPNAPIFVTDPEGIDSSKRSPYIRGINDIKKSYRVGLLPPPHGIELDLLTRKSQEFISSHIDRVAANILAPNGRSYLLLDRNYLDSLSPRGRYAELINPECQRLGVEIVEVPINPDATPYSLNLQQFQDGSVFMTAGNEDLEQIIKQIVGQKNVFTTKVPLVNYPMVLRGGLRCMLLLAPEYIASGSRGTQKSDVASQDVDKNMYPDARRNQACPCGSGHKYKKCHGK